MKFIRVGGTRLLNIDQIVSIVCPNPATKITVYMITMSDHTIFSLTTSEAAELFQLLGIEEMNA